MKKCFGIMMVTLVAAILMAAPAIADSWNVGDDINYSLSNSVGTPWGSGGLFTITNEDTGAVSKSFCLELDEYISNSDVIGSISTTAYLGGRNTNEGDPISSATDWLYTQFIAGIGGYQEPQALQLAFWFLEDEWTVAEAKAYAGTNATYLGWIATAEGYMATAGTHYSKYGSQVMNLELRDGTKHQSQLYHAPVPVPPAVLLLGSGLIGLLTVRRRKIRPIL
jgi:hypothetical protein